MLIRARIEVAVTEQGNRVGETHHNATIPDAVIDRIRDRHENDRCGYKQLAQEFRLSLNTIRKICTYERRAKTAYRFKALRPKEGYVVVGGNNG